jgi:hypothetical protein
MQFPERCCFSGRSTVQSHGVKRTATMVALKVRGNVRAFSASLISLLASQLRLLWLQPLRVKFASLPQLLARYTGFPILSVQVDSMQVDLPCVFHSRLAFCINYFLALPATGVEACVSLTRCPGAVIGVPADSIQDVLSLFRTPSNSALLKQFPNMSLNVARVSLPTRYVAALSSNRLSAPMRWNNLHCLLQEL